MYFRTDKADKITDLIRFFRRTNTRYFSRLTANIRRLRSSVQEQRVLEHMIYIRAREQLYEEGQTGM